eukprot:5036451-Ditylum_brightwellii.AAC.1
MSEDLFCDHPNFEGILDALGPVPSAPPCESSMSDSPFQAPVSLFHSVEEESYFTTGTAECHVEGGVLLGLALSLSLPIILQASI